MKINLALILAVAALCSCQPNKQEPTANNNTADSTKTEKVAKTDTATAAKNEVAQTEAPKVKIDEKKGIELVSTIYNDYVFGGKEFWDKEAALFCTKDFADFLLEANPYDCKTYAIWEFRTDANDSGMDDGLRAVKQTGDNVFTVDFVDNGWKASAQVTVVEEDGKLKISNVKVADKAPWEKNKSNQ